MCVIIVAKDQKPTAECLEKCHKENSDGAGIAWFENETICYKKGFKDHNDVGAFIKNLAFPYIIHFRESSFCNGSKFAINEQLTHPFEISKESNLSLEGKDKNILFQNGTVQDWRWFLAAAGIEEPNGLMNDTRAISLILSKHDNYNFLKKIVDTNTEWKSNKFVVGDVFEKKFKLFGEFLTSIDYPGLLFSNLKWKNVYVYSSSSSYSYNRDEDDWDSYVFDIVKNEWVPPESLKKKSEDFRDTSKLTKKQRKRLYKEQKRYESWLWLNRVRNPFEDKSLLPVKVTRISQSILPCPKPLYSQTVLKEIDRFMKMRNLIEEGVEAYAG